MTTTIIKPTVDDIQRAMGLPDRALAETVYNAIEAQPDGAERLRQMAGPSATQEMMDLVARLEPGIYEQAYRSGMHMSDFLDKEAPAPPWAGADTFEHMLAVCGIRTRADVGRGKPATTVGEMRAAGPSIGGGLNAGAVLLPELCNRAWRMGQLWGPSWLDMRGEDQDMIQRLYASTAQISPFLQPELIKASLTPPTHKTPTLINRLVASTQVLPAGVKTWNQFYIDTSDVEAYSYRRITQGAQLPTIKILTGDAHAGTVYAYGRRLLFTYEVESLSLPMLQLWISMFAEQANRDEESQIISVLINGDGNIGTAANETNISALALVAAGSTVTIPGEGLVEYQDTILEEAAYYATFDLAICRGLTKTLVRLSHVTLGGDQLLFSLPSPMSPGQMQNPETVEFPPLYASADAPQYKIVFVDTRKALCRYVAAGAPVVETDKIIRQRMNEMTMWTMYGHQILMPNCVEILDYEN